MNNEQIYKKVLATIEQVKPYVVEMVAALKRYDSNPCVYTGAKRQDARTRLVEIVQLTTFNLWHNWRDYYCAKLSEHEMETFIQKAIDSVTFEKRDEYECWKGLFTEGNNDEYLD